MLEDILTRLCDIQPVAFTGSVDERGYPEMKAMLAPRVREGARVFYFTTNTSAGAALQGESQSLRLLLRQP